MLAHDNVGIMVIPSDGRIIPERIYYSHDPSATWYSYFDWNNHAVWMNSRQDVEKHIGIQEESLPLYHFYGD